MLSCDKAIGHDGVHEHRTYEQMETAQIVKLSQGDECTQPVDSDPRVDMPKGCANSMQVSHIGIRGVFPHAELDALRWVMSGADHQLIGRNSKP